LLDTSVEYVVSYFGVTRAGGVVVPLNCSLDLEALRVILNDCEPVVLITHGSKERLLSRVITAVPSVRCIFCAGRMVPPTLSGKKVIPLASLLEGRESIALKRRGSDLESRVKETDLACIVYTSGSTGRPKGVMLSHRNPVSNAGSVVEYLRLTGEDSTVVVLPLYYSSGISQMLSHIKVGGKMVLTSEPIFPNLIWRLIQDEGITGLSGVPTTFSMLLLASRLGDYDLRSLRYIMAAGARMPPETVRRLLTVFPWIEVYLCYGLTEASPRVTYLDPKDVLRKIDSVGRAIPGVEVSLLDEDGREVKPGEVGEIVVKGPNVMMGYWGRPKETAQVLRPEGLHTGDLATVDQEGYIYILGRKSEVIKKGGEKVIPGEIEQVLLRHPDVQDCAVVGVPDEVWSEVPKAFVVLKDGCSATETQVLEYCYSHLGPFKVPHQIEFSSSLPKTWSGKVRKAVLCDS
ncbi:MAG: hypothetical protein B1H40_02785, partial [Candidatus Latescibacteria bacterium 4484_181]